jgi:hypothetical protein
VSAGAFVYGSYLDIDALFAEQVGELDHKQPEDGTMPFARTNLAPGR